MISSRSAFDRIADVAANAVYAFLKRRVRPSSHEWIDALRADAMCINGSWARLRWALGGIPLAWTLHQRNRTQTSSPASRPWMAESVAVNVIAIVFWFAITNWLKGIQQSHGQVSVGPVLTGCAIGLVIALVMRARVATLLIAGMLVSHGLEADAGPILPAVVPNANYGAADHFTVLGAAMICTFYGGVGLTRRGWVSTMIWVFVFCAVELIGRLALGLSNIGLTLILVGGIAGLVLGSLIARFGGRIGLPRKPWTRSTPLKLVALAACGFSAPSASAQQPRPPIHPLGEITAKSVSFDSLVNVRVLSDGRVVVNDILAHRLVALDPSLSHLTLIADTSATSPHSYGESVLLPYIGDSVVLLDFPSSAMVVIDPAWTFGRSMAMAKASDMMNIGNSSILGAPAFDPAGRLVYRGGVRLLGLQFGCPGTTPPKVVLDSAPLVRANLESRTIDTLTQLKFVMTRFVAEQSTPGCWRTAGRTDVLPMHGDDWLVMTDGTIAIVREQDYHVDWIAMDGTRTSTPKMPFDWRQLTTDDKQRMIDSATRRRDSSLAARPIPAGAPPGFKFTGPPVVTPDQIPDYYPALKLGSVKVDRSGNLWIPPSTSREAKGGVLYDVVNRKGEVIDRVQLPAGRAVIGFVDDAVVMLHREGARVFIEKARRK